MKYCYSAIDVTPKLLNINLAGFAKRNAEIQTFGEGSLYLKFLWLKSSKENIIFVTLDTLYFPKDLAIKITLMLFECYNIRESEVFFSSTHTHSAPNVALKKFGHICDEYISILENAARDGVSLLSKGFIDCKMELFYKDFNNDMPIIGRRKTYKIPILRKEVTLMLPNHRQKIDNGIRVIRLSSGSDEFLIYNFSCHPVFNSNKFISSDFIGAIDKVLVNGNVVGSLFLQGFCGDIRPKLINSESNTCDIKGKIKSFLFGDLFRLPSKCDFESFVSFFYKSIKDDISYEKAELTSFSTKVFTCKFTSISGQLEKIIKVKLFFSLPLVGISIPAEVLSSYYLSLKERFPNIIVFPMGYAEDMLGYLPHYTDFPLGGYEVNSYENYGWDSPISVESLANFEERLFNEIEKNVYEKGKT